MRIAIQTLGTRGDVQPYLALARGLKAVGHEPVLATAARFAGFVAGTGVDFAPLPDSLLDLMDTPDGRAAMDGRAGLGALARLARAVRPLVPPLLDAQWQAAQGAELIVHHPKAVAGHSIAERLGIPSVASLPLPGLTPTRAFPSPMLPFAGLGPLNRLSHRLFLRFGDGAFRRPLARWREEALSLRGPGRSAPAATLYPVSPAVVPRPPDWDATVRLTGYWFLDESADWRPDAGLRAFLAAGEPPVYVGFGSIPSGDPDGLARLVADALERAGRRGLLATGWGGLAPLEAPHVHVIEGAPHDRLFPLVAMAVHHGGAGTTAAALRAGIPSLVCPVFGDQPFWGRRVAALGAGPAPIPRRRLTVDGLAAAIVQGTSDPGMARAAAALGERIRAEDGVARAVEAIERLAPTPNPRRR